MYGSTCPHLDGHMIKYLLTELGRELAAFVLFPFIIFMELMSVKHKVQERKCYFACYADINLV